MKKWVISLVFLIVILAVGFIILIKDSYDNLRIREVLIRDLSNTLVRTTKSKDSLRGLLGKIGDYQHISETMAYRDSVTRKLECHYGETVRLKPDSSLVTVVGVSVTGGQWSHQVRYLVVDKEHKELAVEPGLLFKIKK